ncbi:hypothetical protein AB3K25_09555 [Leuconostoc sp. MS02]|uniref:Gram-positive cocci surface proteins LPxTG domain-containing protein n=1 Tax=Leuconostoc aquikimchii TaxID=3236804 RepID=A0ABV3S0E6_9LACO
MGNKKTAVSMAVISGAGLVLMGLSTPTVSAATNAPANVIHSKNTVTIDGKTYNITQEQYINNDSDSNTGNETYNPAPVVQDTRPVSDFFDTDDNGNPIVSKAHQQELDAQKAAQQKVTDAANATQTAQQKATDEANAKATADQAKASAQQQAKDDLAAQQDLQQKQAQAEKLVAQQAAADKADAEVKQQADIDEADAKAATQQELQQKQAQAQELLMQQAAAQKIQDQKDAQAKVDAKDPKKIYDKLQKQYQNEFDTTQKENQKLPQVGEKGLIVYPERVNKSNGVSAFGKTDRIRGIAAVLNQYYPVINIGDMESPEDIEYGGGAVGTETGPVSYGYYSRNGSDIFKFELYSGKILYSNLSKSTAGPELIAKYAGFKPLISDDIVAAMIDNEGVISYIHNTGVLDKTIDPNVKFDSTGHVLAPVYPVDVANAIANSNEVNGSGSIAPAKPINSVTSIAPAKPTAPSTEATPTASVPLKTRAEVQADIAAQKSAAKSAAKAAKKATRKVSTATVVPAAFTVNNLTQATNSNHVNVSSPVNTTISQSSVANTDNRDNLPKTDVSNDSKTNNFGIFASLLALISAAVLGLKKKFN